jgi:hypothetical protein
VSLNDFIASTMMHHIVLAMKSFRDTVSPLLVNKRNASVLRVTVLLMTRTR